MDIFSDEQKNQVRSIVDQTVAEFIKGLPEKLRKNLDQQVAAILGFECDSWGTWKVNTFQKESTINSLLSEKVRRLAIEIVGNQTWKPKDSDIKAITAAFEDKMKWELESSIRHLAEEKAIEYTAKIKKELTMDIIAQPSIRDIADPKFMAGMPKIRDVIMNALVSGEQKPKK